MPRLPQATDLNGVSPQAARSFVDQPVPDYAAGFSAVAGAVKDVGAGIDAFASAKIERQRKQERFDTKMALIGAEEAYANSVKDLDPLDPEYVEKKRTARRETFKPVLENVKDPDNRQFFEESTYADYVNEGLKAESAQRTARGEKTKLDIGTYADDVMRKKASGNFDGDAGADIEQTIDDADLDQNVKTELKQKYRREADAVAVDKALLDITRDGYALRPDVEAAIKAVENTPGTLPFMGKYLRRLAAVESSGGYNLSNSTTTAGGIYAFTDSTGKQYGMNSAEDKNDPVKATLGTVGYTMYNFNALKKVLGRDPTPGELYLAHQQDASGVKKLLVDPDARAASVVGLGAVEDNLPESMKGKAGTITAGEYMQYWSDKFTDAPAVTTDPEETLRVIQAMPEYQRLSAPDQLKFTSNMLAKIETDNKEAEKLQKLADARTTIDALVEKYPNPEDRDKAEQELRKSIDDPEYVEKGLSMLEVEYSRRDQNRKADNDAAFNKAAVAVSAAISAGRPDDAIAAIPEGMDPEGKAKLNAYIRNKGGPRTDNQWSVDELTVMASEEPEAFAELSLTEYINDLSGETYRRFQTEQEKIKRGSKVGTTSFDGSKGLLGPMLQEIGVKNGAQAKPEEVAVYNRIFTLAKKNYERAEQAKGSKLTRDEASDVFDQTFMQFRGLKVVNWGRDKPDAVMNLNDVMQSFSAREEEDEMVPGQLLNIAYASLQNKFAARVQAIEGEITKAKDQYEKNRLRAEQRRLSGITVDASMLDAWLREYKPQ